jgi:hypothetical protein
MNAGSDNGVALTNPTVLYVDSIVATNTGGDVITSMTFDVASDVAAIQKSDYQAIEGSEVTHIAE